MHVRDAIFLEDFCPKIRIREWRQSLHDYTDQSCIYCGSRSESIDHIQPRSQGGLNTTANCIPACLSCNIQKNDTDVFYWYRRQKSYDPRRAMAIRAWMSGNLKLALRLIHWVNNDIRHHSVTKATR
uniref:HNH nuclease n=1 Tax=Paulinella longichromatophora TaxID=1708747 RepID=A0A2H4ZPF8_9EUKA|nr:HNH nuclease [Paulinella longichromatophora]